MHVYVLSYRVALLIMYYVNCVSRDLDAKTILQIAPYPTIWNYRIFVTSNTYHVRPKTYHHTAINFLYQCFPKYKPWPTGGLRLFFWWAPTTIQNLYPILSEILWSVISVRFKKYFLV